MQPLCLLCFYAWHGVVHGRFHYGEQGRETSSREACHGYSHHAGSGMVADRSRPRPQGVSSGAGMDCEASLFAMDVEIGNLGRNDEEYGNQGLYKEYGNQDRDKEYGNLGSYKESLTPLRGAPTNTEAKGETFSLSDAEVKGEQTILNVNFLKNEIRDIFENKILYASLIMKEIRGGFPLHADGSDTDDGYDYSLSEPLGSSDTPSDCEDPLGGNYGFIGMMDGPEQPHPDGFRPSDLLKLGRPSLFSGKSDEWPDRVFSFRSFMHLTEMLDSKEMRAMLTSPGPRACYLLAVLLRGRALQILRATEPGAGFEAWRLLCHEFERKDEISAAGLLQAILSFSFDCELGSVMAKLAEFDVLVQAYDSQSSPDGLPDSVKRAVVVKSLPEPLRTQLQLTHPDSYSELRSVIDDFCRAKAVPMGVDVFGQDDSDIIGDIDAFEQSKGKGKGRTRTPRQERPTFNPERHAFDGYCSRCGFFGHGARECRRKAQEQGSELPLPARQTGGQQQQKQAKGKGIGKGRIHEVDQDILQEGEQILGVFEHEEEQTDQSAEVEGELPDKTDRGSHSATPVPAIWAGRSALSSERIVLHDLETASQARLFTICSLNIHRLLVTSVMLSAKFFDDVYYSNAYYAKVGGVKTSELNALEALFMKLIEWRVHVSPQEYLQYRNHVLTAVRGDQTAGSLSPEMPDEDETPMVMRASVETSTSSTLASEADRASGTDSVGQRPSVSSCRLAVGSLDGSVRVWSLKSGTCLRRFTRHDTGSVALRPDGEVIYLSTSGEDAGKAFSVDEGAQ
ncbi:unnamed protein product, partial [Polarella glacialis]